MGRAKRMLLAAFAGAILGIGALAGSAPAAPPSGTLTFQVE